MQIPHKTDTHRDIGLTLKLFRILIINFFISPPNKLYNLDFNYGICTREMRFLPDS
jgi:hypothetical protein